METQARPRRWTAITQRPATGIAVHVTPKQSERLAEMADAFTQTVMRVADVQDDEPLAIYDTIQAEAAATLGDAIAASAISRGRRIANGTAASNVRDQITWVIGGAHAAPEFTEKGLKFKGALGVVRFAQDEVEIPENANAAELFWNERKGEWSLTVGFGQPGAPGEKIDLPEGAEHGSAWSYHRFLCRCDDCSAAQAAQLQKYRAAKAPVSDGPRRRGRKPATANA